MDQAARAHLFAGMHRGPEVLVIANAWDAASARVFEKAGMRAVGTTSAGIAWCHGHPDTDRLPREVLVAATREIAAAVDVPVTADLLNGLGPSTRDVVATVEAVLACGVVGVNLEDATDDGPRLFDVAEQVEKIRAVREAAARAGIPLVINARTDGFWLKLGKESERLKTSIERANRYREAGADCLFVPAVIDRDTIATLVSEIDGPLNILASPGCPPLAELQALGVARVSEGSGPVRAAMMLARRVAEELLATGTYSRYQADAIPYAEANELFER